MHRRINRSPVALLYHRISELDECKPIEMDVILEEWNELFHSDAPSSTPIIDLRFPAEVSLSGENKPASNTRRILIIAGSDSSGGA